MGLWRRLTGLERSEVLSPLGQEICAERIGAVIGGPFSIFGRREVYGWHLGRSFWLRWRDEVWVVQWLLFASVTRVDLEDDVAGTRVRFRSRPSVFSLLMLAVLVVIAGNAAAFAAMWVLVAGPGMEKLLIAAVPVGLGLLFVVIRVAEHLGLDEDPHFEVVKFVSRAVDGALIVKKRRVGGLFE